MIPNTNLIVSIHITKFFHLLMLRIRTEISFILFISSITKIIKYFTKMDFFNIQ
jgi:hypothetical protein